MSTLSTIAKCQLLVFIETHPVLIGLIGVVIGAFIGKCWVNKYRREKRLDANYGFYANIMLQVSNMKRMLGDMKLINLDSGNIFVFQYEHDIKNNNFSGFNVEEEEKGRIKNAAKPLQELLYNSTNNINPGKSDLTKWYRSQVELSSFLGWALNEFPVTGIQFDESDPHHIKQCKALIGAIDYLIDTINEELKIKKV